MSEIPPFDSLRRGDIVLAPDPFKGDEKSTRPWVVVNTQDHPFDGDQYVVMALTTRTWYDERIELEENDYLFRRAPERSSIVPHAVSSLQPNLITDFVCRVRGEPVDRAVDVLVEYL